MKSIVLLVLQLVAFACGLGAAASTANYLFGWSISFKGAEAPSDPGAIGMFVAIGGICAAIVYLAERMGRSQNNPE